MASYKAVGLADGHLTIAAIKKTIDGAIGSRGAWLLQPYSDLPVEHGIEYRARRGGAGAGRPGAANGVQLAVHAIGDRANREVLDIYEATFRANPAVKDWRWRIEHAQHLDPRRHPALREARRHRVDARHPRHLGRALRARPPWRRARGRGRLCVAEADRRRGAIVANGTDAPVERISPIQNLHASITRKMRNGTVFFPSQRMSRAEALRSYTLQRRVRREGGAPEGLAGSREAGRHHRPHRRTSCRCRTTTSPRREVAFTIVGGKVMYRGPAAASRRAVAPAAVPGSPPRARTDRSRRRPRPTAAGSSWR